MDTQAEKDQHSSSSADPMISIRNLHKSFGDNNVLRGFNLDLYDGENLVIVGKSGSGKSVLLKCIVRLTFPDQGEITVLGKDVSLLDREELDELRVDVGFLFQGSALYDSMTVRENLQFPVRRHPERIGDQDLEEVIQRTLASVGLEHTVDLMPAELSGGMKRRIALARTLMLQPKIILYDEPTTGLDPITSREIVQLILDIQREYQTAALIITHDLEAARIMANRMIILTEGIDYARGSFQELAQSDDPQIQAFFK